MYMRRLTYMDIKCMSFYLCKWNRGTDFVFYKTHFENSEKLESIVNIFVFWKFHVKAKNPAPF